MLRVCIGVTVLVATLLGVWIAWQRLWPRHLALRPMPLIPSWQDSPRGQSLSLPDHFLVAQIGTYDDEFFAYLMYQYFAGAPALRNRELLLTYRQSGAQLLYTVNAVYENDLLASLPRLAAIQAAGLIRAFDWRLVDASTLNHLRYETQVFNTAYSLTSRRKIEDLTRPELISYVRRFVRFKSAVDPRIRRKIEPIPRPLSPDQAHQLALDIIAVADFYRLPLEFFLGIGAMENNYMNVEGDLDKAIWKQRASPGDIVVQRARGRVRVLNPASGVWQITRETLRYVHQLYLKDHRDYALLPERLRPARELKLEELNPEVLTTYAGLLFRHLLDYFHGDVSKAVGAYNGGARTPNPKYEEGVRLVADYARRIMEQAASLHGPAAGMSFLKAAPSAVTPAKYASTYGRHAAQ